MLVAIPEILEQPEQGSAIVGQAALRERDKRLARADRITLTFGEAVQYVLLELRKAGLISPSRKSKASSQLLASGIRRHLPDQVVEAGPEIVDCVSGRQAEGWRGRYVYVDERGSRADGCDRR